MAREANPLLLTCRLKVRLNRRLRSRERNLLYLALAKRLLYRYGRPRSLSVEQVKCAVGSYTLITRNGQLTAEALLLLFPRSISNCRDLD